MNLDGINTMEDFANMLLAKYTHSTHKTEKQTEKL
jgi:hypothetical protein